MVLKKTFSQQSEHAVCMSVNNNFVNNFNEAVFSLLKHHPNDLDIRVFVDNDVNHADLTVHDSITYIEPTLDERIVIGQTPPGIPSLHNLVSAYYRFLIRFSDHFDNYENILYLDSDLIITDTLEELLQKQQLFMVRHRTKSPHFFVRNPYNSGIKEKLIEDNIYEKIFSDYAGNSGVLLIPRDIRSKEKTELLEHIILKYSQDVSYADQSLLGLFSSYLDIPASDEFMYNYMMSIPKRELNQYNYLTNHVITPLIKSKIIHFAGFPYDKKIKYQKQLNTSGSLFNKGIIGAKMMAYKASVVISRTINNEPLIVGGNTSK